MIRFLLIAMFLVADPQGIQIERVPAETHRIPFDPHDPQPYIPKFQEHENAITEARFDIRCAFTHEPDASTRTPVTLRLIDAKVSLSMDNTIYLPTDVRGPLRVHEEGHRVINERIYEREAESIARDVVDQVLAKSWSAASVQGAVSRAQDECRALYRAQLAKRISQVNERFDQITRHGANGDVKVVDAIEQAFASPVSTTQSTAQPSTQPTTARTPPHAPHGAR